MMRKEQKTAIIEANKTHEGDTGSPEVQIAILTARINDLTEHLRVHKHDNQRQPQPPRSSEDGRPAPQAAGLSGKEGYRALPRHYRKAERAAFGRPFFKLFLCRNRF